MKKIFLSVVAAMAAVTLMAQAQELPTTCDATIAFKYCFDIETSVSASSYTLPYTYEYTDDQGQAQSVIFTTGEESYEIKTLTDRGCVNTITLTWAPKLPPTGAAGGNNAKGFTVGKDGDNNPIQVFFAQGNLLYRYTDGSEEGLSRVCADGTTQPGIFRFAEHQYDYAKTSQNAFKGNITCEDVNGQTIVCDNGQRDIQSHPDYAGYFSTFPWGGSGYGIYTPRTTTYQYYYSSWANGSQYSNQGWCIPTDIANTYYDWGVYNPIENGGNECGLWRGISADELAYLFTKRENASEKIGKATIKDNDGNTIIFGLILLPDDWTLPTGLTFNSGWDGTKVNGTFPIQNINQTVTQTKYDYNIYNLSEWEQMEAAGAIFLPITEYDGNDYIGRYYTTTAQRTSNNTSGFHLLFQPKRATSGTIYTSIRLWYNDNQGTASFSVRLVSDKKD